eukprot:scaffold75374_cov69-Phaeocystis_antarctica.AAC.3
MRCRRASGSLAAGSPTAAAAAAAGSREEGLLLAECFESHLGGSQRAEAVISPAACFRQTRVCHSI